MNLSYCKLIFSFFFFGVLIGPSQSFATTSLATSLLTADLGLRALMPEAAFFFADLRAWSRFVPLGDAKMELPGVDFAV